MNSLHNVSISKPALCGCLLEASRSEVATFLNHPQVDLLEWRLDYFLQQNSIQKTEQALSIIGSHPRLPIIATIRRKKERGLFDGAENERMSLLQKAVECGVEWVDIEEDADEKHLDWFLSRGVQTILSHHDFNGTPDRISLFRMVEQMAQKGAKVLKVSTYAQSAEDGLRVLDLIPFGRDEFGISVIAFCMGPLGRWSRAASLLLGSPWAYVKLPGKEAAAPGQFSPEQMRSLLNGLQEEPEA